MAINNVLAERDTANSSAVSTRPDAQTASDITHIDDDDDVGTGDVASSPHNVVSVGTCNSSVIFL